jgi:hypothetical protein
VAYAGLAFAALFVLGWLLLRERPPLSATDQELIDYFGDRSNRRMSRVTGLYVIPFAAIAFIWFMAAMRSRFVGASGRENALLSTVHMMAGALFVAALFLIGAVELAMAWMVDTADGAVVNVAAARAMLALGTALGQMVALRAGAVFIAVSTTRAMRSGLFPRWYGIAGMVIALTLLLASTRVTYVVLLMPLWVAGSSVLILLRRQERHLELGA